MKQDTMIALANVVQRAGIRGQLKYVFYASIIIAVGGDSILLQIFLTFSFNFYFDYIEAYAENNKFKDSQVIFNLSIILLHI